MKKSVFATENQYGKFNRKTKKYFGKKVSFFKISFIKSSLFDQQVYSRKSTENKNLLLSPD